MKVELRRIIVLYLQAFHEFLGHGQSILILSEKITSSDSCACVFNHVVNNLKNQEIKKSNNTLRIFRVVKNFSF